VSRNQDKQDGNTAPMTVLVVPCGTEIGLEIGRSLVGVKHLHLIGANSVEDYSSLSFADFEGGLPFVDEPGFLSAVEEIVIRRGVTHIFPAHDQALFLLSRWAEETDRQVKVLTSSHETNRIFRSKRLTYRTLAGRVPVPRMFRKEELEQADYPVFVKPDEGQGSRGARRIQDSRQAIAIDWEREVVCEYLPGPEFTVDCFSDADGRLLHVSPRRRQMVSNGIAVGTELVTGEGGPFRDMAVAIQECCQPRGVWFYQVKERSPGELVLLEAASRLSGSMAASRVRGVNFAELTLHTFNGVPVEVVPNSFGVRLKRALSNRYELGIRCRTVYVDLDDCLLIQGRVNTQLVALLYQTLNRGGRIILLTRHRKDPALTLARHRLAGLFDKVILVREKEAKADHIDPDGAVFIDDSFAERAAVQRTLGIPVFAVDAVEALLDEREG